MITSQFEFNFKLSEAHENVLLNAFEKQDLFVTLGRPKVPEINLEKILGEIINVRKHKSVVRVTVKMLNVHWWSGHIGFLNQADVALTVSYFIADQSKSIVSFPFFALGIRDGTILNEECHYALPGNSRCIKYIIETTQSLPNGIKLLLNKKQRGMRASRKYIKVSNY